MKCLMLSDWKGNAFKKYAYQLLDKKGQILRVPVFIHYTGSEEGCDPSPHGKYETTSTLD